MNFFNIKLRSVGLFIVLTLFISIWQANISEGQTIKDLKLATVNMQKALNESIAGKQSKAKLEMSAKNQSAEFKAREAKMIKMRDDLSNNMLNESAKKKKISELELLQNEYLKDRQIFEQELRGVENQYTTNVFEELKAVINKLAKKDEYDMIIEYSLYSALLYSNLKIDDITDKVIMLYDDAHAKK